jgi:NAD+ diphosphatase
LTSFAYAHSPLDRLANLRGKAEELSKRHTNPLARYIAIAGDTVKFNGSGLAFHPPTELGACILLGDDKSGNPWFATHSDPSDSHRSIRSVMIDGNLSREDLSIVAQARSLVHWHESHRFCAKCGAATVMQDAGYRRHCDACAADHFPRTDPVVIMAVTHKDRTLLGRQAAWPEGMFSSLAGFMEPGETIEDAVRREVHEEVGLDLRNVSYVASQPWPFPSSLMIGMIGEATNDKITIDHSEIETARWFEAAELRLMLKGKHPDGLTASRPDAIAWHLSHAALRRIEGRDASPQPQGLSVDAS